MIDIPNKSSSQQQTISKPISILGIGLHTGKEVTMILHPAKADYGIKFIRKDIKYNNVNDQLTAIFKIDGNAQHKVIITDPTSTTSNITNDIVPG